LPAGLSPESGLHLGKHHTWNRYNRKGNRENQDIVDLNQALLEFSGGNWAYLPRLMTTSFRTRC